MLRAEKVRLERDLQEAAQIIKELTATCHDAHVPLAQLSQAAGKTTTNVNNYFEAPVGTSIAAAETIKSRDLYAGR